MWNQEFVRVLTLDRETVMTRPDSTVVTSTATGQKLCDEQALDEHREAFFGAKANGYQCICRSSVGAGR
jgi:hypothetical protein